MAAHTPWVANPGTTYDNGVVTLDSTGQAAGTSYENAHLDVAVADGDEITFEYRGDCGGGAPASSSRAVSTTPGTAIRLSAPGPQWVTAGSS